MNGAGGERPLQRESLMQEQEEMFCAGTRAVNPFPRQKMSNKCGSETVPSALRETGYIPEYFNYR
jgi:hypothetical protein